VRHSDAAQVKIVSLFVLGPSGRIVAFAPAPSAGTSPCRTFAVISPRIAIISGAATVIVSRQMVRLFSTSIASSVDLQLASLLQIVPVTTSVTCMAAASLLQVERRRIVFTGRGKRTDGQRTHVAERRGNFIGQSQPRKSRSLSAPKFCKGSTQGFFAPADPTAGAVDAGSARRQAPTRRPQPQPRPARSLRKHASRGDRRRTTAPRHRAMLAGSWPAPWTRLPLRFPNPPTTGTSGVRVPLQALQVAAHLEACW